MVVENKSFLEISLLRKRVVREMWLNRKRYRSEKHASKATVYHGSFVSLRLVNKEIKDCLGRNLGVGWRMQIEKITPQSKPLKGV